MKHALVTGAAGFLGSHLVDQLLMDGWEVTGLDNLSTGRRANLLDAECSGRFMFLLGDARDPLPRVGAEVIFSLACPAAPVAYAKDPLETLLTCVLGAQRVVELAEETEARLIHFSTSEIYGDPLEHPQSESYWGNVSCIGPRACYDEGKRAAETLISDAIARGVDARVVRVFNTYGPRMTPGDGRAVPEFIKRALAGEPLEVYGGEQTRSLCYVDDLIRGVLLLAAAQDVVGPVNLGNDQEVTVDELARLVVEATRSVSSVTEYASRKHDPKRRCPDLTKATRLLGYVPRVSLREGLKRTIALWRAVGVEQ